MKLTIKNYEKLFRKEWDDKTTLRTFQKKKMYMKLVYGEDI